MEKLMNFVKKRKINQMHFLLLLMCFFVVNPVYADISKNDAVNMAGKQRMLTQRMLKNYAMLGMGNSFGDPGKDLQQNISLFDETIKSLKALQINAQVNDSLANDEQLWLPIKKIIQTTPEIKKIPKLKKDLDALLDACHKTTGLIAKASGANTSEIINLSGRQRMLSQRLAALYMLQVWGIQDPEFKNNLNNTLDEFEKAQKILLQSKLNSPEINAGLAKVKKLYMWFEIMGRSKSGKYVPSIIAKSSDKILKEMNTITNLYMKAI